MQPEDNNWQAEIDGYVYEVDTPTLELWAKEGRILWFHRVRRGNLRWIEISSVPTFRKLFTQTSGTPHRPTAAVAAAAHSQPDLQKNASSKPPFRNDSPPAPPPYPTTPPSRPPAASSGKSRLRAVGFIIFISLFSGAVGWGWVAYSKHPDIHPPPYPEFVSRRIHKSSNMPLGERIQEIDRQLSAADDPGLVRIHTYSPQNCFQLGNDALSTPIRPVTHGVPGSIGSNEDAVDAWNKYEECLARVKQAAEQQKMEREQNRNRLVEEKSRILMMIEEERREQIVSYDGTSDFAWAFGISFAVLGFLGFLQKMRNDARA